MKQSYIKKIKNEQTNELNNMAATQWSYKRKKDIIKQKKVTKTFTMLCLISLMHDDQTERPS